MKNLVQKIYNKLPFKRELCFLIKFFINPRKKIYQNLYFEGIFTVSYQNKNYFKIKNYNFLYIEKCLFWKGLFGEWEKTSLKIWEELCKDVDYIFDVGANTGVYSLLAKSTNPNSSVYSFEPIKRIYDKLVFNNSINDYDINCIQKAVSNNNEKSVIYDHGIEHTTTASLNKNNIGENNSEVIPMEINLIKLDTFISENKIEKVELIKIDVETFEVQVLEGFKTNLYKFEPTILIEILNDKIATGIENIISGINYEYYNIDEKGYVIKVDILTKSDSFNYLLCKPEIAEKIKISQFFKK